MLYSKMLKYTLHFDTMHPKIQGMERIYSNTLNEYLKYFPCVAIIGSRQCGKTTLVQQKPNSWKYFDLEKEADRVLVEVDPDMFFKLNPNKIIIDEAQELPQIFKSLRIAIDENRSQKGRFIITGSSSFELIHSISESLSGRIGIIELSPLLFKEISDNHNCTFAELIIENAPPEKFVKNLTIKNNARTIHKYWFSGGYPEPWLSEDSRFKELWLNNYHDTYLLRDIIKLFPGMNRTRYRQFISILAGLSGTTINYSNIARNLDTSPKTVKEYFSIAHETFIWRNIPAYLPNSIKRLIKHPRGYLRDTGILHHLLRIRDQNDLITHPNMGASWESMVIEEILRTFESIGKPVDYYYYRTSAGAEVDLILKGKFGTVPIEIKYSQTINTRHLKGLKNFIQDYNCPYGIIINNNPKVVRISEKIMSIPFCAV